MLVVQTWQPVCQDLSHLTDFARISIDRFFVDFVKRLLFLFLYASQDRQCDRAAFRTGRGPWSVEEEIYPHVLRPVKFIKRTRAIKKSFVSNIKGNVFNISKDVHRNPPT